MSNILALCVADREKQIEKCSIPQHCNCVNIREAAKLFQQTAKTAKSITLTHPQTHWALMH